MPIYAYRCSACGHAQDVLQKLSDPVLTTCPACGAEAYGKQVTAAGFQLKGSGWYVTDFRNGSQAAAKPADGATPAADAAPAAGDKPAAAPAPAAPAAAAPAPASAPPAPSP
ncbi:MAG: FmdB family zinc ribbon protein [Betaproteobacteria bacterium]